VDTVFSLGKLHRYQNPNEAAKFMTYLIGDLLKEMNSRVESLDDHLELAYLVKGITNLKDFINSNDSTKQYEEQFRADLLASLNQNHALLHKFDPYSCSKLLRYLLAYNDSTQGANEVYMSLGLHLTNIIAEREAAMQNVDVNDALIDLECSDIVDIMRIYAAMASGQEKHLLVEHEPDLFDLTDTTEKFEQAIALNASLQTQLSLKVLESLKKPIVKKLESATMANLTDVVFNLSLVAPSMLATMVGHGDQQVTLMEKVQKEVLDRVILKDYFNTLNATKMQWSLAKYLSRNLTPAFHLDPSSSILLRNDLSKAKSVSHRIFNEVTRETIRLKKRSTSMNMAVTLYA